MPSGRLHLLPLNLCHNVLSFSVFLPTRISVFLQTQNDKCSVLKCSVLKRTTVWQVAVSSSTLSDLHRNRSGSSMKVFTSDNILEEVRINYVTDISLDFVTYLSMDSRNPRPDMTALFNAWTKCRFVNVQDGHIRVICNSSSPLYVFITTSLNNLEWLHYVNDSIIIIVSNR